MESCVLSGKCRGPGALSRLNFGVLTCFGDQSTLEWLFAGGVLIVLCASG